MKKLWEKMKSFVMQCSHVMRSRWREWSKRNKIVIFMQRLWERLLAFIFPWVQAMKKHWQAWSKRKRVTVCTLSALTVLIAGTAIFCLTVPLFYWWPDGVPIPGTDGTMMFVRESDPEREYCDPPPDLMNFSFPTARSVLLADDDELEDLVKAYGEYEVRPPLRCGITVTKIRKLDHKLSTGEWLETSIAEMKIRREVFDPLNEVRVGESILVYTYNRSDRRDAFTDIYAMIEDELYFVDLRRNDEMERFRELYEHVPHNDFQIAKTEEDFKQFAIYTWIPIPEIVAEYSNYPEARYRTTDERLYVEFDHHEPKAEKWRELSEKGE